MSRIWVGLIVGVLCNSLEGQLVVHTTRIPNDDGVIGRSWWYNSEDKWRSNLLGLENTELRVHKVGEIGPGERIPVSNTGEFYLNYNDSSLLTAGHPAYVFDWLLVVPNEEGVKMYYVDPSEGLNRHMRPSNGAIISAKAILSPYPNPKPFSLFNFLKNPIVLMGSAMVMVTYVVPMLAEGVSLEQLQQDAGIESSQQQIEGQFVSQLALMTR